jgi:hypothetical protein
MVLLVAETLSGAENKSTLKVCDPAMGSGAFLVESCRQLADALVEAWNAHGGRPELPPDEDEVVLVPSSPRRAAASTASIATPLTSRRCRCGS